MNQSLSPVSESRNEVVEVSRRLYRLMMDTTRQLDDLRSHAKTTSDLFTTQAQVLRTKLRETAERFLFSATSLVQRHKIEDVLWRKGFYEDVSTAKRLRKDNQWIPEELSQLILHLKCGVGFYHHLLLCFQTEYGISSRCIDFPMIFPDQDFRKHKHPLLSKHLEAAHDSVHRCLICLGDLNRYLMDIPGSGRNDLAYRYYYQALSWNPDIGMPHNQLGTLSLNINCNLDAVYYYMRCLMCSQPFDGAEGNLKRSFDRNAHKAPQERVVGSGSTYWRCYCSTPGEGQLSKSQDRVQQLILHFLLLADVWFFNKTPVNNISELCHQTLIDFRECLNLSEPPISDNHSTYLTNTVSRTRENFPSYLSKDMVLKIVVVTLICLYNLKKKGSQQVSSLVAFLLALFCLLVQQVLEHFQNSVLNISLPTIKDQNSVEIVEQTDEKCDNIHHEADNIADIIKENGHCRDGCLDRIPNGEIVEIAKEEKPNKRKRIVRRRNRVSENSEESDDEENNILSASSDEDEEVILDLSSDDDEEGKETVDQKNVLEDEDVVILDETNETEENLPKCLVDGRNDANHIFRYQTGKAANPIDILEQVAGDNLLPAIKICSDWLEGDKSIVEACGRDSVDLLKKFVDLVNIININVKELENDASAASFLKHRSILEPSCKMPLPEDAQLQKLHFFAKSHETLDWELIRQIRLTPKEEALVRIHRLVAFCKFLQGIPETGIKYDDENHLFNVCSHVNGESKSKSSQPVSPSVDLQRREEVMHNMGQLWLRAEVQNLETSIQRGSKGVAFPPYVVLDVDALTKYYQIVGQLMTSRKFIMVVPAVVLQALDQLKRESVLARDAIRWLEYQFQKGSRFLRAQTSSEALHLPLVSYPKQKCKEAWSYFQVLECCYYLNHQSSLSCSKGSNTGFVTLLTGHIWTETNDFSPLGVAKAVGIAVEHIESFFTKWKTSSKSHG